LDYLLWEFLKENVYEINQHSIEEFNGEIAAPVESVTQETLAAVMENFSRHQMVLDHVLNIFLLK
jgi:hypothetical protein